LSPWPGGVGATDGRGVEVGAALVVGAGLVLGRGVVVGAALVVGVEPVVGAGLVLGAALGVGGGGGQCCARPAHTLRGAARPGGACGGRAGAGASVTSALQVLWLGAANAMGRRCRYVELHHSGTLEHAA
jgi:hypothetical protein